MKKSLIIAILMNSLFISCVIEGEDPYMIENEHAGRRAFNNLENHLTTCFASYFDIALRMDMYLSAADEQWQEMEDMYFPECKIRRVGENRWAGIWGGNTLFVLETDGRLLSEEQACWKIGKEGIGDKNIEKITCTGKGKWKIEAIGLAVSSYESWSMDAVFTLEHQAERMPARFMDFDWSMTGAGQCRQEDEQVLLRFESVEPLLRIGSYESLFVEGKWEIWAEDEERQLKQPIEVTIEPSGFNERNVRIVYRGQTYEYSGVSYRFRT